MVVGVVSYFRISTLSLLHFLWMLSNRVKMQREGEGKGQGFVRGRERLVHACFVNHLNLDLTQKSLCLIMLNNYNECQIVDTANEI